MKRMWHPVLANSSRDCHAPWEKKRRRKNPPFEKPQRIGHPEIALYSRFGSFVRFYCEVLASASKRNVSARHPPEPWRLKRRTVLSKTKSFNLPTSSLPSNH